MLLSAPWLTQRLLREAYRYEEAQIEIDNHGIRLGRELRRLIAAQLFWENQLRTLEEVHHKLHLCGADCLVADKELEGRLFGLSQAAGSSLRELWTSLQRLLPQTDGLSAEFPFELKECSICEGRWLWSWYDGFFPVELEVRGAVPASMAHLCVPGAIRSQYWLFADKKVARRFCGHE